MSKTEYPTIVGSNPRGRRSQNMPYPPTLRGSNPRGKGNDEGYVCPPTLRPKSGRRSAKVDRFEGRALPVPPQRNNTSAPAPTTPLPTPTAVTPRPVSEGLRVPMPPARELRRETVRAGKQEILKLLYGPDDRPRRADLYSGKGVAPMVAINVRTTVQAMELAKHLEALQKLSRTPMTATQLPKRVAIHFCPEVQPVAQFHLIEALRPAGERSVSQVESLQLDGLHPMALGWLNDHLNNFRQTAVFVSLNKRIPPIQVAEKELATVSLKEIMSKSAAQRQQILDRLVLRRKGKRCVYALQVLCHTPEELEAFSGWLMRKAKAGTLPPRYLRVTVDPGMPVTAQLTFRSALLTLMQNQSKGRHHVVLDGFEGEVDVRGRDLVERISGDIERLGLPKVRLCTSPVLVRFVRRAKEVGLPQIGVDYTCSNALSRALGEAAAGGQALFVRNCEPGAFAHIVTRAAHGSLGERVKDLFKSNRSAPKLTLCLRDQADLPAAIMAIPKTLSRHTEVHVPSKRGSACLPQPEQLILVEGAQSRLPICS